MFSLARSKASDNFCVKSTLLSSVSTTILFVNAALIGSCGSLPYNR